MTVQRGESTRNMSGIFSTEAVSNGLPRSLRLLRTADDRGLVVLLAQGHENVSQGSGYYDGGQERGWKHWEEQRYIYLIVLRIDFFSRL